MGLVLVPHGKITVMMVNKQLAAVVMVAYGCGTATVLLALFAFFSVNGMCVHHIICEYVPLLILGMLLGSAILGGYGIFILVSEARTRAAQS